jgi:hypothetical protein
LGKNKFLLRLLIILSFLFIFSAHTSPEENSSNPLSFEISGTENESVPFNEFQFLDNNEEIEEIERTEENLEYHDNVIEESELILSSEKINDPITNQEFYEIALISGSQKYIGTENAQLIVNQLGFVDGRSESVSNACGPLSIAILRDAGLLCDCVSLHDIWLLNLREPDSQLGLLYQNYFPPQLFDYIWVDESVRNYDFDSYPLQPGDWLFLFTAGNGFDHMLTVTQVDQIGIAYTVTNIDRGEGFIISEEILYDPQNPTAGLFFELTDNERKNLGKTGTQGFLLVRRKGGLNSIPLLNRDLDIALGDSAYWRIYVRDINSGEVLYESLPNQKFHSASMVKPPITLVALEILEGKGFQTSDFSEKGFNGRTFDQLFNAMVVLSEEDATETLLEFIRQNGGEKKILEGWGLKETNFEPRRTTVLDLDIFLNGLYQNRFISPEFHNYLLTLMKEETENDSAYLGVISEVFPDARISNKRGLLLSPTIVSDMGIVEFEDRAYSIVISSSLKQNGSATYEALQKSLEDFVRELGEMLLVY